MQTLARLALEEPSSDKLEALVTHKHISHVRVQAIEKIWDFYFELFGQRQGRFGKWLVSCDRIALDCYQDAYTGIGIAKSIPAPPPFAYMRTGFGPATFRRGLRLRSLGRRLNPFPLIQLPYIASSIPGRSAQFCTRYRIIYKATLGFRASCQNASLPDC